MPTAGLDTQPSAATYDLEDLIAEAWTGGIRVPHFQRDFRWGRPDVIRLLDSIAKGFPIGSLLLWVRRSPAQRILLGTLEIDAPASDGALWVVDGQQRITSLANVLHPEGNLHPPFNVSYDLVDGIFIPAPAVAESRYIPLPVLFDLEKLLDWFNGVGNRATPQEYFSEARRIAKVLRQFKVPAYLVRQDNEQILTDIFDRMNNFGKRLSRAEIFSALFAGPEQGAGDRLSIGRIPERVAARTGFGPVDDGTVLAAILARRGPNPAREIRNEFDDTGRRGGVEFPGEDRDVAYAAGEQALVRAIFFLREYVGVPHISLLAYRAILVVLTRFFAHFPEPAPRNLDLLRRLYWRLSVSGPAVFKGSFTVMSRALSARIIPGSESLSVDGLFDTMAHAAPAMPNLDRFRTNEAGAKIILSSWWALGPRSPINGERYGVQELSDLLADQSTAAAAVRRVYPRGVPATRQLWAANRLFVPSESDPVDEFFDLFSRRPPHLGESDWLDVLASYCLTPEVVAFHASGDRDGFLAARQVIIAKRLEEFLARMTEWEYEDTPPLDSLILDDQDELDEAVD